MKIKTLVKSLSEQERKTRKWKSDIAGILTGLADNPKIRRLSPGCFTMNFSDLGDNWSVPYHDFPSQYRLLADECLRRQPLSFLKLLREIRQKGKAILSGPQPVGESKLRKFHPSVVSNVLRAMGIVCKGDPRTEWGKELRRENETT